MSQTTNTVQRVDVRSSRLWALLTLNLTQTIFRAHMIADPLGISTVTVTFWLTPWVRRDEHLPMSHIAEVGHDRGFFWDRISVESSGGINPLTIDGVPKGSARRFVDYVRERMNAAPPVTPPPAPNRR